MTEIEPPTDDLRALFANERDVSDVERVAIRTEARRDARSAAAATATIVIEQADLDRARPS